MRRNDSGKNAPTTENAKQLAFDALLFLVQDEQRIAGFLEASGMTPADLRTQSREDGTLAAVLAYILANESLLLVFSAHSRHPPESIQPALDRLERSGGTA